MKTLIALVFLVLVSRAPGPEDVRPATPEQNSTSQPDDSMLLTCDEIEFNYKTNWYDDWYAHSTGKDVLVRFVPTGESTTVTVATRASLAASGFVVKFSMPHPSSDRLSVRTRCTWRRDTPLPNDCDDRVEVLGGSVFVGRERDGDGVPKHWKFCLNVKHRDERKLVMGGFAIE